MPPLPQLRGRRHLIPHPVRPPDVPAQVMQLTRVRNGRHPSRRRPPDKSRGFPLPLLQPSERHGEQLRKCLFRQIGVESDPCAALGGQKPGLGAAPVRRPLLQLAPQYASESSTGRVVQTFPDPGAHHGAESLQERQKCGTGGEVDRGLSAERGRPRPWWSLERERRRYRTGIGSGPGSGKDCLRRLRNRSIVLRGNLGHRKPLSSAPQIMHERAAPPHKGAALSS